MFFTCLLYLNNRVFTHIGISGIIHLNEFIIIKRKHRLSNHLSPKGFWNMLFPLIVFLLSTDVFLYFFLQLSKVVDLNVYLKIWWLLKIESFFKVF